MAWRRGSQAALAQLVPLVHHELRRIARSHMAKERAGHLLQTTALINEAFVRLVDIREIDWKNRAHFLAVSARVMRRVLVDFARAELAGKRGGRAVTVAFDELTIRPEEPRPDLLAIDHALQALAQVDERKANVVEYRFFGGLSVKEVAAVLGVSEDTVLRDWKFAREWLSRELRGELGAANAKPRRTRATP